eukprot:364744-Chlamydomonas_euryale.AAC.5
MSVGAHHKVSVGAHHKGPWHPRVLVLEPSSFGDYTFGAGVQVSLNRPPFSSDVVIDPWAVQTGVASAIGLPGADIAPTSIGAAPAAPLPPEPPEPPAPCDDPKLGSLCGKDAVGAIVGIAVGGALLLALLAVVVYYLAFRGSRSQVQDEYEWASKYAYAMDLAAAVQRGTPYIQGYGTGNPLAYGGQAGASHHGQAAV